IPPYLIPVHDTLSLHDALPISLRIEWSGFLTPTETGEYTVGVRMQGGFARVEVDGKPLAHGWVGDEAPQVRAGHIHLEQGKKVHVKVGYGQGSAGPVKAQLIWSKSVLSH